MITNNEHKVLYISPFLEETDDEPKQVLCDSLSGENEDYREIEYEW